MPHAGYHREQARRCREIAAGCDHALTRDALQELAEQYEERADWIDRRLAPQSHEVRLVS